MTDLPTHDYTDLILLLADVTVRREAMDAAIALLDSGDVDWASFVDAAARHKVLPLIGRNLVRLGVETRGGNPYPLLFAFAYVGNRARNETLAGEYSRVFAALERADVVFAVRKGFFIAEHFYGDSGVRQSNDLDLLVERSDVERAGAVLESLNYAQGKLNESRQRVEPFSRETRLFWKLNLSNELPFLKPALRDDVPVFNVDLCHNLFQKHAGASIDTGEVLARRERSFICNTEAWAMSPADALLDICAHLHKEATSVLFVNEGVDLQLSKFLDVALVSRRTTDASWDLFLSTVRRATAERIAFYSLYFAESLFPGSVPTRVLETLAPSDLGYLDDFGTMDGETTRWMLPFRERLFHPERHREASTTKVPMR